MNICRSILVLVMFWGLGVTIANSEEPPLACDSERHPGDRRLPAPARSVSRRRELLLNKPNGGVSEVDVLRASSGARPRKLAARHSCRSFGR